MASEEYVAPMINFWNALNNWGLGDDYVVLCLDPRCMEAAEALNITAYGGYLLSSDDELKDWHVPVARMKVNSHSHSHPEPHRANSSFSLQPTSI